MRLIYYHICPHLGHTAIFHHLDNWYTFQEFFGLRVSELKHSNKTSRLFFLCCFCDEAWSALYDAATTASPVNIHGIWTKISEFPPENAKLRIITNQNAVVDRRTDFHPVHTDRLVITTANDEKRLLLHTPNLAAVIPASSTIYPTPCATPSCFARTHPPSQSPLTPSTWRKSRMTSSPTRPLRPTCEQPLPKPRPMITSHPLHTNLTTLTLISSLGSASRLHTPHPLRRS
jgi:hypothetical protein